MLVNFFLGISSGLPLLLIGSTLQAWMTDEKVDLKLIGLFSLVGVPYTFKFAWAPLMDRYVPRFLGRRRGWILITQILLALSVASLSFVSPAQGPGRVALLAVIIAFFSASQDIVFDAYRREVLSDQELGLGSSMGVNGYRIGMLISGAFALYLADQTTWHQVYLILAAIFLIFGIFTILAPNPVETIAPPSNLSEAVFAPLVDYFRRSGSIEILLFIVLYKIGDVMAANLTTPFYLNLGFTKTQIATIVKSFGLAATLAGTFLGGLCLLRWGIFRSLWVFGILQASSTAAFALLARVGPHHGLLTGVIAFENVASGMGTSAFVAFMGSLTNRKFTAFQYALLSSLIGVPRAILASPTGYMQSAMGWESFFLFCAIIAIPGMLLLLRFNRWQKM